MERLGSGGHWYDNATAEARLELAGKGLGDFAAKPWFGGGIGATGDWVDSGRPHNMYLLSAAEGGMLGLFVFLALIGALWYSVDSVGRVAVVVFAVANNFTHNNLEDPKILCLLAIMAVANQRANRQDNGKPEFL